MNVIPLNYLRCRSFGHAWDEFEDNSWEPSFGFKLSLLCTSCGTERHDIIDTTGGLAYRRYIPAPGYRVEGGTPFTRAEYKLAYEAARDRARLRGRAHLAPNSRRGLGDTDLPE